MKRALVLALCLLVVGIGSAFAEKERVTPFHPGPQPSDMTRDYFEGFEGGVPPATWTLTSSPLHPTAPYTWYQESWDPFEGFYHADCQYDDLYLGPQNEWLKFSATITPTENHLNFAAYASYYWMVTPYANYDLQVTVNGTMLWSMQADPTWSLNWTYYIFDVDLSAYIGQTVEIGFNYVGYDGAELGLDAVGLNAGYVPPPSGACCDELGGCTFVQEANCFAPSVWHGEWTCSPNNCPAPPPVGNDVCATAYVIPCGAFTLTGTTTGAQANYSPTTSACTGYSMAAGPDVTYYIDLAVGDAISVTMTTTGWDDAIYLVKDCANIDGTCVAGADDYPDGSSFLYSVPAGGAGRYYLIVDGYASSSFGDFTVTGSAICAPPVATQPATWGKVKALFR